VRRRLDIRLALLAAVLAVCGLALASSAFAGSQRTTVTVYRPFAANGKSLISGPTTSGTCLSSSLVTPRRDAWHCMAGSEVYDPCFSSPKASGVVLCVTAPWRKSGVKVRLQRPLPKPSSKSGAPSAKDQPWALQLYSGQTCLLTSGAAVVVGGQSLDYTCGGVTSGGLWGFPSRHSQPWTIFSAPATAKRLTQRVKIRLAWT